MVRSADHEAKERVTGRATATSRFGVGRRENHDSRDFYRRFPLPELSSDDVVRPPDARSQDRILLGDARRMPEVGDASVALVVTSPPYFAGKEYEEALGKGYVPSTYVDYLELLEDVFAECLKKLEPGGRIAINVANLGRKPYRSLSADVMTILQDRLGMLLRGEILWVKGRGASGSCAWGSFQNPSNPVLRDLTERVVVASKGRFDRALTRRRRARGGLPSEITISRDEFMESTTDVWNLPAESATRVGHPAPFPVALPERLINLYTYRGDLVLDPFVGSGSSAIAAARLGRLFVGYDTDPSYVELARRRVRDERDDDDDAAAVAVPLSRTSNRRDAFRRALEEGRTAKEIARVLLERCGFSELVPEIRVAGLDFALEARDRRGGRWLFDVSGSFARGRSGLARGETLWKVLGKASALRALERDDYRLVLLTSDLPTPGTAESTALDAMRGSIFKTALSLFDPASHRLLRRYASGSRGRSRPR
jgi:modification methylase